MLIVVERNKNVQDSYGKPKMMVVGHLHLDQHVMIGNQVHAQTQNILPQKIRIIKILMNSVITLN
jgi:hypothetical protein